jgi:hypothetical protein
MDVDYKIFHLSKVSREENFIAINAKLISLKTSISRTIGYFKSKSNFKCDHMLTFVLPLTMHFCSKSPTIVQTLELWLFVITITSFTIGFIGMTSGQHHPRIYHEGDELP